MYPALAVARSLASRGHEVRYVGTPDGPEARIVAGEGLSYHPLPAKGFDRSRPMTLVSSSWIAADSARKARRLIRDESVGAAVAFGGYVCLPVGFAAAVSRVPLVLHEQNSVPGLANRLLSRWAVAAGVTYPDTAEAFERVPEVRVTGNPVRSEMFETGRGEARERLDLPRDGLVLLVFGGSRGARHVNEAVVELYPRLRRFRALRVLHLAGSIEAASVRERLEVVAGEAPGWWHVYEYLEDMAAGLAAADLVVARAGATSIAEITAMGRASVLVPYPYATGDHQTANAEELVRAGGAVRVADDDLDSPGFGDIVIDLLERSERRERMERASAGIAVRDAAERVATLVEDAVRRSRER